MRTIRTKLYSFEELNDEAKQVAIEDSRDINVDYSWWEFTYKDAENIGLKLNGFDLDRNKHANGEFINDAHFCANEIIKNHGEHCQTYTTATDFLNKWEEAVKLHSKSESTNVVTEEQEFYFDNYVADYEKDFLKDILNDYANMLQNESEYLQSDEAIIETLIVNEYEYLSNGKQY